jgi:hypothetical protein
MAGKPEVKQTARVGREPLAEISERTATAETTRTIAMGQPAGERPKAAVKPEKAKARKGKLQMVVPLLVLWKLRIAAAHEGVSVGKLLLRWITEPLKAYSYPPIPEWLKKRGASEDELNAAA